MKAFLNILRFFGLLVFGAALVLLLLAVVNFFSDFSEALWLEASFIRVYLFLMVAGILVYILITFRRRKK